MFTGIYVCMCIEFIFFSQTNLIIHILQLSKVRINSSRFLLKTSYKVKTIRQTNIGNRQGYLFNDMTNINDFDPSLLNIDEVLFESNELIMHNIKYIKNFKSLNSLYLVFDNLYAYIEESGKNKYLNFASTEKNKIMLENYTEL